MTTFDMASYLNNRFSAVGTGKVDELNAAREAKITSLQNFRAALSGNAPQLIANQAAQEESWVGQAGLDAESFAGSAVNLAAEGISGVSRLVGTGVSAIPGLEARRLEGQLGSEEYQATATPEHIKSLEERAIKARQAETNITEAFNRNDIVDQTARNKLQAELKAGFTDPWKQYTEGGQRVYDGDLAGAGDIVSGMARLLYTAGKAAVNNPRAALGYAAENTPQLAVGAIPGVGPALMAGSNMSYGNELYSRGIENYRAANNGAMPPDAELKSMAMFAASAVAAEQAGDVFSLGSIKAGSKAITKAGFKESLKNIGSVAGKNYLTEGGTEGYQTFAEGAATGEKVTASDIFTGSAIGAMSGAQMAGAGRAVSELAQTTPEAAERKQQAAVARKSFDEAAQANDTTAYLDPQAKTYDPQKAVGVLYAHTKLPDVTPEVKAANLTKAREIVQALEQDYANKENLLDSASIPSEVQLAKEELVTLKAQLNSTDPQLIDEVSALNQRIAFREQVVALSTDNRALKRLSGEVKSANEQLSTTKKLQEAFTDRLRTTVSTEDVATHINKVSRAMSVDNMPDMEDSRQSAQALVNIAMVSPDSISTDSVMDLVNNSNSALSTEQRDYFRQFSEARQAENKLMSLNKVSQAIFTGTKNDVGIIQYRKTIGQALEANDQRAAEKSLGDLVQFAQSHTQKQALATQLFSKVRISGDKQVRKLKKGGWEVAPSGKPLNSLLVSSNGGFTIHPNSGEFVGNMQAEVEALNAAVAEQQAAFTLKFGKPAANVSTKVPKVDTSPAPVQKEEKSVQVKAAPAAQTTAAPTSVAPVVTPIPVTPSTKKETNGPQTSQAQQTEAQGQEPAGAVAAGPVNVVATAEEIALEAFQAQVSDRVLRLLNPEEKTKLTSATNQLDSLFKDVLKKTTFYVQSGVDAAASAFHAFPVIGITDFMFTNERLRGETEERHLLYTLAHELAHLKDQATGYESEITDAINRGGVVYDELQAMLQNPKDPFVKGMFGYILVKPKIGVNVPREIYAQLAAIYANDPQLLKATLPYGYAFIQDQFASVEQEANNQVGSEPGNVTQEAGTGLEPAGNTGATEPRLPGGTVELLSDTSQGLTALQGEKSAPNTPYQDRNLLVDHFSQSVAGVTAASQRPLVMVKDFISTVSKTLDFSGFLKDYKATDKQEAALKLFVKAAAPTSKWSKTIQGLLIHGYYTKDGKYNEDKKNFYQNPFNWMISKDDKGGYSIEENTNTALVYAAFTTLLELADAPATNNDKTLNGILGRAEDAEVPAIAYQVLGTVGTRANLLRNSSGKTAVAALGLKTDKDAGQNLLPQLEGGMGGLVEAFLLKLGLLEETVVTAEQMNAVLVMTQQIDGKAETRQVKDNANHVFIKVARDPDTGEFTSAVQEILEGLKGSNNVLDKLMSVEAQLKYPSLTPIVSTQTTTKTGQQVPRLLTDTNNQNSSQANYAREDMWKLLNAVSP